MPIKLTSLTAATSAAASDLLYAVIGGNSRKITLANLFGTYPGSLVKRQTVQVASGQTALDFTGIPTWVQRVVITMSGFTTSGTSPLGVRIGDGAIVATGYLGAATRIDGATPATQAAGTFFYVSGPGLASTSVLRGRWTIERHSGNAWVFAGNGAFSDVAATVMSSGEVTLTGDLDRLRITTSGGTDTFTAGSVNIAWE